jgi:hypothetical protein
VRAGDELAWALDHARNVDLILTLEAGVRGRGRKELSAALDDLERHQRPQSNRRHDRGLGPLGENWRLRVPTLTPPWHVPLEVEIRDMRSANTDKITAQSLLAALIAPNLAGVPRVTVVDGNPPRFHDVFQFIALIQVIYWQIADRIGSKRLQRCDWCRAWFLATDGRQRFCLPPPGVRESRCGRQSRKGRED